MIQEILLVHHSHTDIGYTHPQPVVLELHRRFIDQALDMIDETTDWPDASRFRWTCEVTGITMAWWAQADKRARDRFLEAAARGQLEVAGFGWNMTPLMDHQMLIDLLQPTTFFRDLGLRVRSAMNCDVNGLPWGVVEAFLDHGITGFSMAINEHFGYAPQPRPRAFAWQSPAGRELLAYNGVQYGIGAELLLGVPADMERASHAVSEYCARLENGGYPHSVVMMQVTNPLLYDNAAPNPALSAFVREWNEAGHKVGLRVATLSELFDRLRNEPNTLEPMRGDWTDWWNFGAGSTAYETALSLSGQRALSAARQLRAWPGKAETRQDALDRDAAANLALYAEHTWGADRSIQKPRSGETRNQQNQKLGFAYHGYSIARMLQRDGLERLAHHAGGDELTALVYNPLPYPVKRSLRVPAVAADLQGLSSPQSHMIQRQDVMLGDAEAPVEMPWQVGSLATRWVGPLDLPALGYASWGLDDLPQSIRQLHSSENSIHNADLDVTFDIVRGGVKTLVCRGHDFVSSEASLFALPVLERPATGLRSSLFGPPAWDPPDKVHRHWHTDWEGLHEEPNKLVFSAPLEEPGCAAYQQRFEMTSGDLIDVTYRLFPDEDSLELDVKVDKQPLGSPHSLYLPLTLSLSDAARFHFETAGAVVELDREQLPNVSRHYVTTQRFVHFQDDGWGVSIACPDAPLWQVGGFTFGRHQEGNVKRRGAIALAWLTNNYWDTNFQADQSGLLRFRFRVRPHLAQPLGEALQRILPYTVEPQLHLYRERGEMKQPRAGLLDLDLGGSLLTGLKREGDKLFLKLLNPVDDTLKVMIGPDVLTPQTVTLTDLAGGSRKAVTCSGGKASLDLPPRAWCGLEVDL